MDWVYTVEPVYSGHLSGPTKLAAIERWPGYTSQFLQNSPLWPETAIERWPDYTGRHNGCIRQVPLYNLHVNINMICNLLQGSVCNFPQGSETRVPRKALASSKKIA